MINPVDFFKALADDTRLNIMMLVAVHQELCVCDLQDKLELSQPKISRHLALLRTAGLLADRRQGQWVYYRLHPELADWCLEIIKTMQTSDQLQYMGQASESKNNCCE